MKKIITYSNTNSLLELYNGHAVLDMSDIDQNFIKKWGKALRSGEYCQATGHLKQPEYEDQPDGRLCYCCIGVACVVRGIEPEDIHGATEADHPNWVGTNPGFDPYCDWRLPMLARLNDGDRGNGREALSFEKIADIIDPPATAEVA